MTAMLGSSALQSVLGALGALAEPEPTLRQPERAQRLVDLDDLLVMLAGRLESAAVVAPELAFIRDRVRTLRDEPFDTRQTTVFELAMLATQVHRTLATLVAVGPPLVHAAQLAEPGLWLAGVSDPITAAARKILKLYADAVIRAWQPLGDADAAIAAADAAAAKFPEQVCELYLHDLRGIRAHIITVGELRDDLLQMKQASGRPLSGTASLDDVGISAAPPPANRWLGLVRFENDWSQLRSQWDNREPGTKDAVQALGRKLQAYTATLTALTVDEELQTWVDELIAYPTLKGRLNGYRTELAAILGDLHTGFATGGAAHAAGFKALQGLLTREQFRTDVEDVVSALNWQAEVKSILVTTAIVAAAALTGGFAASVAGATIGLFAGEAAILGVSWAAVGAFTAEVIVFTMVNRFGTALAFGEQAIVGTTFWEDALWNAAMIGTLRAVEFGFTRIFMRVGEKTFRFRAGKFVTSQISLLAFAEFQQYARTGSLMSAGELGRAAIHQVAMSAILVAGGYVGTRFSQRVGALATRFQQADVQALDVSAAALAVLTAKVANGTATAAEREALAPAVEKQWNDEVKLVESLPQSEPLRAEKLAEYAARKAELELRLAKLGFETTLSGPTAASSFAPVEPGTVAFEPQARPTLEKFHADRAGTLTEVPGTGLLEGKLPTGEVTYYAPAGTFAAEPPKPVRMASGTNEAHESAPLVEQADRGMQNLSALFSKKSVEKILGRAGPEQTPGLLQLLAHPEFEKTPGQRPIAKDDVAAFATSPEARDFAAEHGPRLAIEIKRKLGATGNEIPPRVVTALERASELIEKTPEPGRPQLIQQLRTLDRAALESRLGTAKPKPLRPKTVTKDNIGVDQQTAQWRGIYNLLKAKYGNLVPDQVVRTRADIEQAFEAARLGKFRRRLATDADRRAALTKFGQLLDNAQLAVGPLNAKYGAFAEWLFLPDRAGGKLVFLNGTSENVAWGTPGTTVPDGWKVANGLGTATELKANKIHDPVATKADVLAVARQHHNDAIGDATNLPPGSIIELRYVWAPRQSFIDAMLEVFTRSDTKITRVKFGDGDWIQIVPK